MARAAHLSRRSAALVNVIVFAICAVMYLLMRCRIVEFGYRG